MRRLQCQKQVSRVLIRNLIHIYVTCSYLSIPLDIIVPSCFPFLHQHRIVICTFLFINICEAILIQNFPALFCAKFITLLFIIPFWKSSVSNIPTIASILTKAALCSLSTFLLTSQQGLPLYGDMGKKKQCSQPRLPTVGSFTTGIYSRY